MYVYVDESGNTGYKIFDPEQPVFVTAALITKTNFDVLKNNEVSAIARKVGASALHANELGVGRIEVIADDLLVVIKQADARFFISRLDKVYLATAKVFDAFFDAGENLAVPWHIYWLRPLRLTLMFKLAHYVITEEIARTVWDCVTAPTEQKSKFFFLQAGEAILNGASNLPDERSREVVTKALRWALDNPENFSTYLKDKVNRNAHTPNFVAFSNLMDGISHASRAWGRPVREIVHDEQSEFEKTFRQWHEIYSRTDLANTDPIHWPGESEPIRLGRVTGSQFRMATEETSAGLQVIDVILWIFKRVISGRDIGPASQRLLNRVYQRGRHNDLTFEGAGAAVEQNLGKIYNAPFSSEQEKTGAELMATWAQNSEIAMQQYSEQKKLERKA